jgi:predicted thioesterase
LLGVPRFSYLGNACRERTENTAATIGSGLWKLLDLSNLTIGLKGSADLLVGIEHTAPRIGSGRVGVLATPVMINIIEAAALAAVEHLLPSGHQSLGIHLDIRHFAATPVGMRIEASSELIGVDGRMLLFRVEAHDEKEPIGGGLHKRVVVNVARFDQRVQKKLSTKSCP